ncbi:DUF6875 domain-containing protein [Streptomyces sp. NPDC021100]|uniref:DUF6875 domain-containing protein n=1 Tax=Streptomyces sp. NPDC021100 TaxID=3365114 RepID=UPI0037B4A540
MRLLELRPPFEPGSLTDATTTVPATVSPQHRDYQMVREWLTTFVARPHARLGRPGDICPRLAPALRRDLVRLVALRTGPAPQPGEAHAKGLALAVLYRQLFPEDEAFRNGALLCLCPDLRVEAAARFIDEGHRLLRMDFVARGLMIGEFHPASTVGSVHNPQLKVMRCPVPMFAVRALTRHDQLFLDRPGTPAPIRAQYLRHLMDHLGGRLPASDRTRLQGRVEALEGAA